MSNAIFNYAFSKVSKKLKFGTYIRTGKNFSGKTCVFHRGSGYKKTYRNIDFYRRNDAFGLVCSIQYDPYRSGFIGLVLYDNGLFSYILLAEGVKLGQRIYSGRNPSNKFSFIRGSSLSLSNIGLFSVISNIEARPNFGGSLARAAGVGAVLISSNNSTATLKLRSSWLLTVPLDCIATIGHVSNANHNMKILGKAGKNRGLGKRPTVRGVAMNPCDHPHGGGNGKTSPPAVPVNRWGKPTKWTHTKNKKADKLKRRLFKKLR